MKEASKKDKHDDKELAYKNFYEVLNNSKDLVYISSEQLKTLKIGIFSTVLLLVSCDLS